MCKIVCTNEAQHSEQNHGWREFWFSLIVFSVRRKVKEKLEETDRVEI